MTENSAEKRAARQYQADHPGTTYPEALRRVRELRGMATADERYDLADYAPTIQEMLKAAVAGDTQLIGVDLTVNETGGSFDVDLGPEIEEGPVTVDAVDVDVSSLWYDEVEEFEGGTSVGEAHVEAKVSYSVCVFKSTFHSASDDVKWDVVDHDWNDHYVRVSGEFEAELVYQYTIVDGYDQVDNLTLEDFVQLKDVSAPH